MNENRDAVNNAWNLIKQGNYRDALAVLEAYSPNDLSSHYFLASLLLECYNKLEMYNKASNCGENLCTQKNCSPSIKQNYAWSLYFAYFKKNEVLPLEEAIPLIERIASLTDCTKKVNPLVLTIFSYLTKNKQLSPEIIIQLLDMLKFDLLDDKAVNGKNKYQTFPSQKEKYICYYTKALFLEKNYSRCIACCKRALELSTNYDNFKNKGNPSEDASLCLPDVKNALFISPANLIWIKRYLALSLFYLGEYEQAYLLMQEIIKQKKDWFLYYELSQITQKLNKIEDALRYAAIAAYSLGDIEMKIHLWEYLYQLLLQTKNFPQAVKILSLSAAVRAQKGWKISPSLKQEIDKHNLQPENLPSYKNIFTELKPWFIEMSYSGSEVLTGYISNILASNKAGFITTGKKYYYFKTSSCLFEPEYIVPNTKVSFNTEKSFDPKKQKDSIIAVNIKRI